MNRDGYESRQGICTILTIEHRGLSRPGHKPKIQVLKNRNSYAATADRFPSDSKHRYQIAIHNRTRTQARGGRASENGIWQITLIPSKTCTKPPTFTAQTCEGPIARSKVSFRATCKGPAKIDLPSEGSIGVICVYYNSCRLKQMLEPPIAMQ